MKRENELKIMKIKKLLKPLPSRECHEWESNSFIGDIFRHENISMPNTNTNKK